MKASLSLLSAIFWPGMYNLKFAVQIGHHWIYFLKSFWRAVIVTEAHKFR
jgi:hypothetical protein